MDKTHRITFKWGRTPYIYNENATVGERIQIAMLKKAQDGVFKSVTETMFAAHNVSIKKDDKKKDEFEIFIEGSEDKCLEMQSKFENLHQLDFSKALSRIPFRFKKKVKKEASESKFKKMQEQLMTFGIYFEVEVNGV